MTVATESPVFIGGLSHSGKTPLRIVLAANPALSLTRRTYLWDRFYGRFGNLREPRNLERCIAALAEDPAVAPLSPDPASIRAEVDAGDPTYARVFGAIHRQHADRLGKPRWGEQLGFVERYAEPIFASYPSARMIHMVRDPRFAPAGGRRRPGATGWETARWRESASLAAANGRRFPAGYLVVRYEGFAADPEATVREVCAFLDEPVLPEMRERLGEVRFDDAAIRPRVSRSAFIDRYAVPELPALGYPKRTVCLSRRDRIAFELMDRPINRASMAAWSIFGEPRRSPRRLAGAEGAGS
jgi:hypothetical protein